MKIFGNKLIWVLLIVLINNVVGYALDNDRDLLFLQQDTSYRDTSKLKYPFPDQQNFQFDKGSDQSPLHLTNPTNVESEVYYDATTNEYVVKQKIGNLDYRPEIRMSLEEYQEYQFEQAMRKHWREKYSSEKETFLRDGGIFSNLRIGGESINDLLGNNAINIVPTGSAELIFSVNINKIDKPEISEKLRKTTTFEFDSKIMMNVNGSIGDKIRVGFSYNTEATFDFENETKLEYAGKEDEIIQKIEAGNVTLPIPGSLITGSQSLFGIKTELKFGNLTVTGVVSEQRGEKKTIEVKGGSQAQQFEILADEYDANRHFFLSHYFKEYYNEYLQNIPILSSPINITKIEVWVSDESIGNETRKRSILALTDLGESKSRYAGEDNISAPDNVIPRSGLRHNYPENDGTNTGNHIYSDILTYQGIRDIYNVDNILANEISQGYVPGEAYDIIDNAKQLTQNEFRVNPQLGYISLNMKLKPSQILAVAYEYTVGDKVYRVGEFPSTSGVGADSALVLKMLKGINQSPRQKYWELMMKNVYNTGSYQIESEGFILDLLYRDNKTGNNINYLPEKSMNSPILIDLLGLDKVNVTGDAFPDGRFDFIDGITVTASNGRIIFPVLEPFGEDLEKIIGNDQIAQKYVYNELYDSTLTVARQIAEKNKFTLKGESKSSVGSEIYLNSFNIPEGSVVVSAGGMKLEEGVHYTVDYNLGRVQMIGAGLGFLESGTPIQITLESNSLYNIQTKTLWGTHLNYRISDDFNIGATVMNLRERPLTHKVGIGEEPINNTIWGLNTSYRTESQLLTTLIDKLPLIETKEKSSIMFDAEFAHLIPGHSKAIEEEGNAYVDDFEGSETQMTINEFHRWELASTPVGRFPEAILSNDLDYGKNRAWIAWYDVAPKFNRKDYDQPGYIEANPDYLSNHFVREVYEREIFPFKEYENNFPKALSLLNIAFYPKLRGPYNFDTDGLNTDGTLMYPEERWGGIMRDITTEDFEAQNVEYIEFWMMDPFVYDSTSEGGQLYFNLGEISEDILKDSKKSFENGLPTPVDPRNLGTSAWGAYPTTRAFNYSFSDGGQYKLEQDLGLDGLNNDSEREFFKTYLDQLTGLSAEARQKIEEDPSNDDFVSEKSTVYDDVLAPVLERYKRYNGVEGNSKDNTELSNQSYPDKEDINGDRTMNTRESYYEYIVNLRPEDMQVGQNYINDKINVNVKLANGEQSKLTWYQFRIPVRTPDNIVGNIRDFSSIRFARLYLTGFTDSIMLRISEFALIRSEWRKYNYSLLEGQENLSYEELPDGTLKLSSVNIEENSNKTPVNYVLPPGVDRVIDPSNPQIRQLNEQSMVLNVENLADGDARAVYKNINLDIRQYGKLKMFVHAEALENEILDDGELSVFIRLGTDYRDNYYEYEIPVTLTPHGEYNNSSGADREIVWPIDNNFEIDLDIFTDVKLARNDEMRRQGSDVDFQTVFSILRDNHKITVYGNPNLSNVRTLMVGVRNPSQKGNFGKDDGQAKSAEIWINELRLSNFNEKGGWAAKGRMSVKLADLGSVNIAGLTSTPGFGGIEMSVNERSKEQVYSYDISTNLDLGKLFPEKAEVSIPMYAGFAENFINPEYNPLDPDITMKESLNSLSSKSERDSLKNIVQDYTKRRSINFTNVKINKTGGKPRFYSPANVSMSYSFNEVKSRNINTEYNLLKNYKGSLNYIYNTRPKNVAPFRKTKAFSNKAFRIIKDINFNYMPSSFSFRTDVSRYYNEILTRNINDPDVVIQPTYSKDFNWTRDYALKYDLTKALKLDFKATNIAKIDEPEGVVNKDHYPDEYEIWKREVWNSIENFGRNTEYHQELKATWRIPINKLPLLDWVNANASYGSTYNWDAGPILTQDIEVGNTIRNSNTAQVNGQLNLLNLYNKVGYLKKVNQRFSGRGKKKKEETKTVTYEQDDLRFRANRRKTITHNLNTEDITVKVFNEQGVEIKNESEVSSKKRVFVKLAEDADNASILVEGKVKKRENPLIFVSDLTLRLLMSVRNFNLAYSQTQGSSIDGYMGETTLFGMRMAEGDLWSPGLGYVFGVQDEYLVEDMIKDKLMRTDTTLLMNYLMTDMENWNIRGTVEPIKGLRIDVTGTKTHSQNNSRYYKPGTNYDPNSYGQQITGNYSVSVITIGSAFEKVNKDNNFKSDAFNKFLEYRSTLSQRIGNERASSDPNYANNVINGYSEGYGELSQEVLIPAFIAAYSSTDSKSSVPLDFFSRLPMPNWRVNFTGLKDIPLLKKYFKSINIGHTYRSTFNVGSYISNSQFINNEADGYTELKDQLGENYISKYDINSVTINEQFAPLINFDVTMQNNLTARFDWKKSRVLSLSFANYQLSEMRTEEYRISLGYRFDDFDLIFDFGDRENNFKSDLNIMANFSIRENVTVLRKISEDVDEVTAGQQSIVIGASADYLLSDRLTLRIFYDQTINEPFIDTSYPTSNTSIGFSFRFTLSQ